MDRLGTLYEYGLGVAINKTIALEYYRKASSHQTRAADGVLRLQSG